LPILDWMSRSEDIVAAAKVPYRMLEAAPELDGGNGDPANMLIQGDNLDALKALLPFYAGRVKCIYIDPPYNTRSAFEHYDDNLEHAQWLSMIYPRLMLLRELLAENGSIWVSIDDHEGHYLKVVMDEVFGRQNFVTNVVWEKVYTPKSNGRVMSADHDHLIVYGKSSQFFDSGWNLLPRTAEQEARFSNADNDPGGPWRTYPLDVRTDNSARREKYRYEVTTPSGRKVRPSPGRHWSLPAEVFEAELAAGRIYFGKDGSAMPTKKVYLKDARAGVIARTWWTYKDVGGNQDAKREVLALFGDSGFITPKPENLLARVLHVATDPGDLVLDSFLGSGTTAAVAHKMERQWIGIEMGDHAETHCKPRLDKVIDGEQGGISEAVEWKGGGGYRYYRLGSPAFDATGRIEPDIGFNALAAHIWFAETGQPADRGDAGMSPILGLDDGTAYALLYNGILGDRRPESGNVLTLPLLSDLKAALPDHDGPWVIYGEACKVPSASLKAANVTFKQTPYDVKAR
jgi:adenine-specific DNA-methyltransferase